MAVMPQMDNSATMLELCDTTCVYGKYKEYQVIAPASLGSTAEHCNVQYYCSSTSCSAAN
jgi:hypothetical protein